MNIRNIFKTKNELLDISKISDTPKVIVKYGELQKIIKKWLGFLDWEAIYYNEECIDYLNGHYLNGHHLKDKMKVSNKQLKEITAKFGYLLKLAGIDADVTCTLNRFDPVNNSLNCHFNEENKDVQMILSYWQVIDCGGPKLIINDLNESKSYHFSKRDESKYARLEEYTIENLTNKNVYHRCLSPSHAYLTLTNDLDSISIDVEKPKNNEKVPNYGNFKLENEEQIQEYLLGLTFPVNIDEVYKKICKLSPNEIAKYSSFKIKIARISNNGKTTDILALNHGQLQQFTITKNDKTITMDGEGNWSYETPNLTLKEKNDYDLLSTPVVVEKYNSINQEVEQVRKLTKNILKKDFND